MMQIIARRLTQLALSLSIILLAACGGGDSDKFRSPGSLEAANLNLAALDVVVSDYPLDYGFEVGKTGSYSINQADQEELLGLDSGALDMSTVTLTATLSDDALAGGAKLYLSVLDFVNDRNAETSGEAFTVDIDEGDDTITVYVGSADNTTYAAYVISTHRTVTEAFLSSFSFGYTLTTDEDGETSFDSSSFDVDVTDYTLYASNQACSLSVTAYTNDAYTYLYIDDVEVNDGESVRVDLTPGIARDILIRIVPEDGSTENEITYTFSVLRAEATDDDDLSNARLASLSVGDDTRLVGDGFRCNQLTYSARINNANAEGDIDQVWFTATADYPDATLSFVTSAYDPSSGSVTSVEQDISSGVPFSVPLPTGNFDADGVVDSDIDLDFDGDGVSDDLDGDGDIDDFTGDGVSDESDRIYSFSIVVTPASGTSSDALTYSLTVVQSLTRERYATTAEQLQDFLTNAEPNDEIIVAYGTYVGDLATSGSADAYFYVPESQSGTADSPIYLRGEGTLLNGVEGSTAAVLEVAADHWVISDLTLGYGSVGLKLSGAENTYLDTIGVSQVDKGIELDASSDNTLFNVAVVNVNETGVVLENGSSNNILDKLLITSTGQVSPDLGQGVVFGSSDSDVVSDNQLRSFSIGDDVPANLVEVNAGAQGTVITAGLFNSAGLVDGDIANHYAILQKGSNTDITYNTFYHEISTALPVVIDASEGDARIFDNIFSLGSATDSVAIAAGDVASVKVDDNSRDDDVAISYSGSVDETFVSPLYQIQSQLQSSEDDELLCVSGDVSAGYISTAACSGESVMLWDLVHQKDGNITFRSVDSNKKLAPISQYFVLDAYTSHSFWTLHTDTDDVFDDAYYLYWSLNYVRGALTFSSKEDSSYFATMDDFSDLNDGEVGVAGYTSVSTLESSQSLQQQTNQTFNLLEVAQ